MTDDNGNVVRVTLRDVYSLVSEVRDEVRDLKKQDVNDGRQLKDHEQRLRQVEKWKYALPPTFLLAVASLVAAVAL